MLSKQQLLPSLMYSSIITVAANPLRAVGRLVRRESLLGGNVAPANAIDAFEQLAQSRTISGGAGHKDVLYSRLFGYNASKHDRL